VVAAIVAATVSVLTVVGLAAQNLGRRATSRDTENTPEAQRRHLDRTLAELTRTLNERFATAADQLGSDKPAVRLAGVHAMAGLADGWEANRQTRVDVVCAYLRMPYASLVNEIQMRMPAKEESSRLGLPTGTSVAEHIRTGVGKDGKPLRMMITIEPGDRHTLVYELDTT
jgi:hypothetical protein